MKQEAVLFLNDSRGVYIPRDFATAVDHSAVSGVDAHEWETLAAGPDNEYYWDVWRDVLDNAVLTDSNGRVYRLYHDGDLWLIPDGMTWNDETGWFE